MRAVDLFDVGWVTGQPHNPDGQWVAEISSIDRTGRCTPKWVPPESALGDQHPETQRDLERLLGKAADRKFGIAPPWSVLVPKTRPYLRKFGLHGPSTQARFTVDLLAPQPRRPLTSWCDGVSIDGAPATLGARRERRRATACCLLWLLCVHGPLGDLFDHVARWGKKYPTLHLDDVADARIPASAVTGWIAAHDAVARAAQLASLAATATQWQTLTLRRAL